MRRSLLLLGLLTSCSGGGDDVGDGSDRSLLSLTIMGATGSLRIGETGQLSAVGMFADGRNEDRTEAVTWRSYPDTIATVGDSASNKGFVTALASGDVMITATSGSIQATIMLTIASFAIEPSDVHLPIGGTQQFSVREAPGGTVAWSSSDDAIVSIDASGIATALATGTASIIATIDGASATTTVQVEGVVSLTLNPNQPVLRFGESQQFNVNATFTNGSSADVTEVATWQTSNDLALVVSNAAGSKGMADRIGAGSATLTVSLGEISASVFFSTTCSAVLASDLKLEGVGELATGTLLVGADDVFWFEYDRLSVTLGAIRKVSKQGGPTETLVSGLSVVQQFAVDDAHVYWMETPNGQDQAVRRVSIDGGDPETIHELLGLGGGARGIAVHGAYVYWVDGASGGAIQRMPKGGGGIEEFGRGENFAPTTIAVDDDGIYGAEYGQNNPLRSVSIGTGLVGSLTGMLISPRVAAIDSNAVFVQEPNDILAVAIDGSGTKVLANNLNTGNAAHIGIDDQYAYFPDSANNRAVISRVPKFGGPRSVAVSDCDLSMNEFFSPISVAADATQLYIIDRTGSPDGRARLLTAPK